MLTLWVVLCLSAIIFNSHGVDGKKKSDIHRPCKVWSTSGTSDLDCIRKYFVKNFDCTDWEGPVPDPFEDFPIEYHIPHANLSIIETGSVVRTPPGDAVITEFYINRTSGNVVLEIVYKEIIANYSSCIVRFYRKGKEPVDIAGHLHVIKRQISLTLVFPQENGVVISESTVYAYIGDPNVTFHLGPSFTSIKDPELSASLRSALVNAGTTLQEVWLSEGHYYMSGFFESKICKLNK